MHSKIYHSRSLWPVVYCTASLIPALTSLGHNSWPKELTNSGSFILCPHAASVIPDSDSLAFCRMLPASRPNSHVAFLIPPKRIRVAFSSYVFVLLFSSLFTPQYLSIEVLRKLASFPCKNFRSFQKLSFQSFLKPLHKVEFENNEVQNSRFGYLKRPKSSNRKYLDP